jgi:hypothetical protein
MVGVGQRMFIVVMVVRASVMEEMGVMEAVVEVEMEMMVT